MFFEVAIILDFQMVEFYFLIYSASLRKYIFTRVQNSNGEVHISRCAHMHINNFNFGIQQGTHKTKQVKKKKNCT